MHTHGAVQSGNGSHTEPSPILNVVHSSSQRPASNYANWTSQPLGIIQPGLATSSPFRDKEPGPVLMILSLATPGG